MVYRKPKHHWWRDEHMLMHCVKWSGFLLALLAIGYLGMVNRTATLGLEIRELERTKEELKETGQRLEFSVMHMQSLDYAAQRSAELLLRRPEILRYLDGPHATSLSALVRSQTP